MTNAVTDAAGTPLDGVHEGPDGKKTLYVNLAKGGSKGEKPENLDLDVPQRGSAAVRDNLGIGGTKLPSESHTEAVAARIRKGFDLAR